MISLFLVIIQLFNPLICFNYEQKTQTQRTQTTVSYQSRRYPIMKCLKPLSIRIRRNWIDEETGQILPLRDPEPSLVPCGKCEACLQNKRRSWAFRLQQELKVSTSAFFITLTYNDENLPPRVNVRDCQLFLKRLRKEIQPYKIRYFLVSEYGGKFGRPHYHMLLFNFPDCYDIRTTLKKTWQLSDPEMFDYGDSVGSVTPASISYVCKYCLGNLDSVDDNLRTFMLCSRRPAIGYNFLTKNMVRYLKEHKDGFIFEENGFKVGIPRYYAEKAYSPEERAEIRDKRLNYINNKNVLEFQNENNRLTSQLNTPLWVTRNKDYANKIRKNLK